MDSHPIEKSKVRKVDDAGAMVADRVIENRSAGKVSFTNDIFVPFVATRIMLLLIAWLSLDQFRTIPPEGAWELDRGGQITTVSNRPLTTDNLILNAFSRWDSGWYYSVAKFGYHFVRGQPSNTAFFPLYPLLMRLVHLLLVTRADWSWYASGIIVSNVALLAGLYYLYRIVQGEFNDATARRAVFYVLIFPTTLYYSAVYSESLFLLCTVAAIYYARGQRWWIANAFAAGAALTRSPGIVLLLPLVLEYLRQHRFKLTAIRWNVLSLTLAPLALAAIALYMYCSTGNLFAVRDAQLAWHRQPGERFWPWNAFNSYFTQPTCIHGGPNSMLDLCVTLLFLCAVIASAFKLRLVYSTYGCAILFFLMSWGSLGSMLRYVLALFPCFIVFALWGQKPVFHRVYTTTSIALAGFFMMLFVHWRWVS